LRYRVGAIHSGLRAAGMFPRSSWSFGVRVLPTDSPDPSTAHSLGRRTGTRRPPKVTAPTSLPPGGRPVRVMVALRSAQRVDVGARHRAHSPTGPRPRRWPAAPPGHRRRSRPSPYRPGPARPAPATRWSYSSGRLLHVVLPAYPDWLIRRAERPVGMLGPLDSPSSSATHPGNRAGPQIWSPNDQLAIFKWVSDCSTKIAGAPNRRS
jgi:hypothetical protein